MSRPELIFVTPRFWPLNGGAQVSLAHLARHMAEQGWPVTVLTRRSSPHWPLATSWHGSHIILLPAEKWLSDDVGLLAAFRGMELHDHAISHLMRRIRPGDLVYVSGLSLMSSWFVAAARYCGARTIVRPERAGLDGDCFRQLEISGGIHNKRCMMQSDAFVAATRGLERELIAAGYPRQRIHYIPAGAPVMEPATLATRFAARATLCESLPELRGDVDATVVLWHGTMIASAGLTTLLDAWERIIAAAPKAVLWLVGGGPERAALCDRVQRSTLAASVRLLGEFDAVDDLLTAADLYAAPASDEGTCVALQEAMAAGLPIVASDIPGHRGLLEAEKEAIFARVDSADELAAGLRRLLDDPSLGARLGEAARNRAMATSSLERMCEDHVRLFERLLALGPSRNEVHRSVRKMLRPERVAAGGHSAS